MLHFLFFLLPEYDHQDAAEQDVDGKHKRKHVGNQREYHADKHPDAEYYVEQGNKQMPEGTVARINLEKADYLERAAQDEYESDIPTNDQKRDLRLQDAEYACANEEQTPEYQYN